MDANSSQFGSDENLTILNILIPDEKFMDNGDNETGMNNNITGVITRWNIGEEDQIIFPIVCTIAGILALIIAVLFIYLLVRERRKRKNSFVMQGRKRQRFSSISTISDIPPSRYFQIFDQEDGVSVFEESADDYDVVQPDLVRTVSNGQNSLSRASSTVSSAYALTGDEPVEGRNWERAGSTNQLVDEDTNGKGHKGTISSARPILLDIESLKHAKEERNGGRA